jgi:hypothetical protein
VNHGESEAAVYDGGGTDTVASNNVTATANPYSASSGWNDPNDFKIDDPNSAAVGAGLHITSVLRDFGRRLRDPNNPDVGAWAYSTLEDANEPEPPETPPSIKGGGMSGGGISDAQLVEVMVQ